MPRQRFLGQHFVDLLIDQGFEVCPEPEGPPTGTVVLSRDCADPSARLLLVHATVDLGASYAERICEVANVDVGLFWRYLDGV